MSKSDQPDWDEDVDFSSISDDQMKALCGYKANEDELNAIAEAIKTANAFHAMQADLGLPTVVDWRNRGGNWVTSIQDQKNCGSCVSFAVSAVIESAIRIACRNSKMPVDLSEAFLFFCGCGKCCNKGWNFAPALDFSKNTGFTTEQQAPYNPNNQVCKERVQILGKLKSWDRVMSISDRKRKLASVGPLVGGMAVYDDFFKYKGGVYKKGKNARLRGYHAIAIIGYDDTRRCWICKNSWGKSWGDNGFFCIGYGECDIDTRFPFYEVSTACPVDPCKRYLPFLSKVLAVARRNMTLRTCLVHALCGRRLPVQYQRRCIRYALLIRLVVAIMKKCPKYRIPFCRALGA